MEKKKKIVFVFKNTIFLGDNIGRIRCTKHTQSNVMAGQWRGLFGVRRDWCVLRLTDETHSHRSGRRQHINRHITVFCTFDPADSLAKIF